MYLYHLIAPGIVIASRHGLGGLAMNACAELFLLRDRTDDGGWPDPREAELVWQGSQSLDIALLKLIEKEPTLPRLRTGLVFLESLEEIRTLGIGFPGGWSNDLHEYLVWGDIRSAGSREVWTVKAADNPDSRADWLGFSGTPIVKFLEPDRLLVFAITEAVPANFSGGMLHAASLRLAYQDEQFRTCLRVGSATLPLYTWRQAPILRINAVGKKQPIRTTSIPTIYEADWSPLIDGMSTQSNQAFEVRVADFERKLVEYEEAIARNRVRFPDAAAMHRDLDRHFQRAKTSFSQLSDDALWMINYLKEAYIERNLWPQALNALVSLRVTQLMTEMYTDFLDGARQRDDIVANASEITTGAWIQTAFWDRNQPCIKVVAPLSFLDGVSRIKETGAIFAKNADESVTINALLRINEWDYLFNEDEKAEFWTRYAVPQAVVFGQKERLPPSLQTLGFVRLYVILLEYVDSLFF